MVNPTIEEAGHYNPQACKCPVCSGWWGLHSIEEENDHAIKILDWLEKNEKAQKIFENAAVSDFFKLMLNPKIVRHLREYFKNSHAPARDGPSTIYHIHAVVSFGKKKGVFTAKEIREYFKNIPSIKGTSDAKPYLTMTKEQRRKRQQEIKNRKNQQSYDKAMEFLRKMK